MKRVTLGRSSLEISVIGLGAWAIGGSCSWEYSWGEQDDKESVATIRRALERGVNWIDTAPAYGLGHSESVIGSFLKEIPAADKPLVFTKCGLIWKKGSHSVYSDLSPASIQKEIDMSLRRLGVDVIDLYQIHWPSPNEGIERAWETMANLKRVKKVRHIGVSNFSTSQLERMEAIAPVETLQPNYSLLSRSVEVDILPYCRKQNIGVISYSPMASGMLSGKMTRERIATLPEDDWRKKKGDFLSEPRFTKKLALVDILTDIANQYGRSAGEVAVAWVLKNPGVSATIVGMRRPEQTAVIAAENLRLGKSDLDKIESFFIDNPELK